MPITEESVRLNAEVLPQHMREGAVGYVLYGWEPGSFLQAVLRNDLIDAAANADDVNKYALHMWAVFVYNAVPAAARGSADAIRLWHKQGGLLRGQR
jgi:hypothetical protein